MAVATNINQLVAMINGDLKTALEKAAKEIHKELLQNLNRIYSPPEGSYYKRSNELLKAVIKPVVTMTKWGVEVTVGIDTDKITSEERHDQMFNQHMNIDGGTEWRGVSTNVAILNFYDAGTDNRKGLPSVPKTDFWYDVMGDREYNPNPDYSKLIKKMEKYLEKQLRTKVNLSQM